MYISVFLYVQIRECDSESDFLIYSFGLYTHFVTAVFQITSQMAIAITVAHCERTLKQTDNTAEFRPLEQMTVTCS